MGTPSAQAQNKAPDAPDSGAHGALFRNVAWLSLASAAVKPLWFAFIIVLCARLLSAENYGVLNTALSLSALTFSITGLGMGPYIVREVAIDRARAPYLLARFLVLRFVLGAIAIAGAVLASGILGYPQILLLAVLAACVYQIAFSLSEFSHHFFQAFERLHYQAASVLAEKSLVIVGGLVALVITRSPVWTLVGMAIGMVVTAAGTLGLVHLRVTRVNVARPRGDFFQTALRPLLLFALAGVLGMFFFRIDTIMVEAFLGLQAAGQYGLAFRIVEALNMLPYIVVHAALYPRLSRLWSEGALLQVRRLVRWASAGLLVLSIPIVLLVALPASWIVTTIVTDAALLPAAGALQLLAWVFPLTCVRVVLYAALLATGSLRPLLVVLSAGLAINIGLNVFAIPAFGISGAAGATIVSEAVVFAGYLFIWLRRRDA